MVPRGGASLIFLQASEIDLIRRGLQELPFRKAAPVLARLDHFAALELTVPVEWVAQVEANLAPVESLQRWEEAESRSAWERRQ